MSATITAKPDVPAQAQPQQQRTDLLAVCAGRYAMQPKAFAETVVATCFPDGKATAEQLACFLAVANEYGLNPFTKQIFAFPTKGGGIATIVSVDGWAHLINSNPRLDGIEFVDHVDQGRVAAITCRMYRKDRSRPTEVTEYLGECLRDTEPWRKWPARMLRHRALIQCARYAFGLGGIYDEEEAERMVEAGAAAPNSGPEITLTLPGPAASAPAAGAAQAAAPDPGF